MLGSFCDGRPDRGASWVLAVTDDVAWPSRREIPSAAIEPEDARSIQADDLVGLTPAGRELLDRLLEEHGETE
jgi:hypothetical protein